MTTNIQTLTAEIRVLQVNGLQITPLIAKQLDRVPIDSLQVMGRVRLGKEPKHPKTGLVIGVARDGSLALAEYDRQLWLRSYYVDVVDDSIVICPDAIRQNHSVSWVKDDEGDYLLRIRTGGVHLDFDERATKRCGLDHRSGERCPESWRCDFEDAEETIAYWIDEAKADRLPHEAAAKSPLIVLGAGVLA